MEVAHRRSEELVERWLRAHGASDPACAAAAAMERAGRYPRPVGEAWPALAAAVDRLGPLLLGRLTPARRLDDGAFAQLERALQHHPSPLVRAAWLVVRAPALEALYEEPAPPRPPHPLRALEGRIRAEATRLDGLFDVVVVGSGAGGAPLAWRLATDGLRVAVVEAGGLLDAEPSQRAVERHYLDQGMVGGLGGGGSILVMAGRAVGGTTAINSGTSLRPLPERLAAWDRTLGTALSRELQPWLDEAERRTGVSPPPRERLDASADVVERGLAALGWPAPHVLPRNAPGCSGVGRCCFGCGSGAKQSTDRAFLPAAVEAGAVLLTGTTATRIREERDHVEILVRTDVGIRRLRTRELVLAAGALSTPHLVRSARLGAHWRQAGDGLRVHPATKVLGRMPEPLREGGVPQGLGWRTPDLPRLTFEGIHTPAAVTAPLVTAAGPAHRAWMARHDRVASFGMMCRDRRSGRVRGTWPARWIRYGLHPGDARDLGAGVLRIAEMLFAGGAERVLLPVAGMEPEIDSVDTLRRLRPEDFTPARLLTSGFHAQGTAGMGRVVDPDLALTGRIHVCDASVLPDSPGVNPQITLFALSLRLADRLATRFGRPAWAS